MEQALFPITEEAANAKAVLEEALAGELVSDEQMLDCLRTLPGTLTEAVSIAGTLHCNLTAKADMLKDAIDRLEARYAILIRLLSILDNWTLDQCEAAGITRIVDQRGFFSLQIMNNPPRVVIDDEKAIPLDYVKTELVDTIQKKAIATALKEGREVPGAHLERGKRLVVK